MLAVIGGEGDRGPMRLLPDARRQNSNHPLVPVRIEQRQPPGQARHIQRHRRQQLLGLALHLLLDGTPLPVEGIQLARQAPGLLGVVCQQAGNADAHVVEPAGGVETGPDHETQIGGTHLPVVPTGHVQQRQDARTGQPLANAPQPLLHEDPVVVIQWHHIGDGAQGHQVQQAAEIRLRGRQPPGLPQVTAQRGQDIEHHAHACGVFTQERAARLVWIDDGIRFGQRLAGQVVVGHQHPDTQRPAARTPSMAEMPLSTVTSRSGSAPSECRRSTIPGVSP